MSNEPDPASPIVRVELGEPRVDLNSHGDVWDPVWAADGQLYVSSDDSRGFNNQPGSNLQFHLLRGDHPTRLVGTTINPMAEYGRLAELGPDQSTWKANGCIAVDGNFYLFVSRHGLAPNNQQKAENTSLIMSTDYGRTWRRSAPENYDHPQFPGRRFGSPFFVKYGQDGQATVDGADRYVYALANNGFWENGDDLILARIPKTRLPRLAAADWQFFVGGDGQQEAAWSPQLAAARPVLVKHGMCSMTGAQYLAPLKRYLMVQWYYTTGTGRPYSAATVWLFYEAPKPWGPWRAIGTQHFQPQGYYNPCIVPQFISPDGRHLTIFTNGNFTTHDQPGAQCLYRLTVFPCTLHLASSVT